MKRTLILLLTVAATFSSWAQTSPNGKIRVSPQENKIVVEYRNEANNWQRITAIDAQVATNTNKPKQDVTYKMKTGKRSNCSNSYVEGVYVLKDGNNLNIRVFNDGVAWSGQHSYKVDFSASKNNWLQKWVDCYEEFFPKNKIVSDKDRIGYPALFEYENNVFALISESNVNENCAFASLHATESRNVFEIKPDGPENAGWQTVIIGKINDIVESTLIADNSEDCKYSDISWIEPGVASWIYWANNHGSKDFNIIKKYVDMATTLHLPYVLIDAEWDEMKDGKTIEDAVNYAVNNGIKPIIWYNSSVGWINGAPGPKFRLNKPEDREKEFAWCEKIGVKGVKIDFFSGDNNLNVSYMVELLKCAEKHHLLVNFHGATIPRGWQRTYPNLISVEGVYGAEWYNNVPTFTDKAACHNAMLPYTRNVIGPMDYTPCAFSDSQHPHITSRGHELALTALYESGIQHLADRPESFLAQPNEVKDYLGKLPTAWDDTKFVSGYPGESVVMVRRKQNTWYIAGINGTDSPLTLDLSSLKSLKIKSKNILIFNDKSDSSDWEIVNATKLPVKINCVARGGFVIVVKN